jgi:hypothetical protein
VLWVLACDAVLCHGCSRALLSCMIWVLACDACCAPYSTPSCGFRFD